MSKKYVLLFSHSWLFSLTVKNVKKKQKQKQTKKTGPHAHINIDGQNIKFGILIILVEQLSQHATHSSGAGKHTGCLQHMLT